MKNKNLVIAFSIIGLVASVLSIIWSIVLLGAEAILPNLGYIINVLLCFNASVLCVIYFICCAKNKRFPIGPTIIFGLFAIGQGLSTIGDVNGIIVFATYLIVAILAIFRKINRVALIAGSAIVLAVRLYVYINSISLIYTMTSQNAMFLYGTLDVISIISLFTFVSILIFAISNEVISHVKRNNN